MKKLLVMLSVLLSCGVAQAADLPIPTKDFNSVFGGYARGGCGAYFGLNAMGSAGSAQGPVSTNAIQGDLGVTIGYGCPFSGGAGNFWFVEGNFDWSNVNGTANGLTFNNNNTPAHFEQRFALGSPISTMLNMFGSNPTQNLSVPLLGGLPAGVTAGPSYPFLFASLHEQDVSAAYNSPIASAWLVSPGIGIGLQSRLSNGVVSEVAAQWVMQSQSITIGNQGVRYGNEALVSFALKY